MDEAKLKEIDWAADKIRECLNQMQHSANNVNGNPRIWATEIRLYTNRLLELLK